MNKTFKNTKDLHNYIGVELLEKKLLRFYQTLNPLALGTFGLTEEDLQKEGIRPGDLISTIDTKFYCVNAKASRQKSLVLEHVTFKYINKDGEKVVLDPDNPCVEFTEHLGEYGEHGVKLQVNAQYSIKRDSLVDYLEEKLAGLQPDDKVFSTFSNFVSVFEKEHVRNLIKSELNNIDFSNSSKATFTFIPLGCFPNIADDVLLSLVPTKVANYMKKNMNSDKINPRLIDQMFTNMFDNIQLNALIKLGEVTSIYNENGVPYDDFLISPDKKKLYRIAHTTPSGLKVTT